MFHDRSHWQKLIGELFMHLLFTLEIELQLFSQPFISQYIPVKPWLQTHELLTHEPLFEHKDCT